MRKKKNDRDDEVVSLSPGVDEKLFFHVQEDNWYVCMIRVYILH